MSVLKEVTCIINDVLNANVFNNTVPGNAKYYGVAQRWKRNESNEEFPAINEKGVIRDMVIDERSSLVVYHKIQSTNSEARLSSFGDDLLTSLIYEMSLFVWINLHKFDTSPEDVMSKIHLYIPDGAKVTNTSKVTIKKGSINHDTIENYNAEFRNSKILLQPMYGFYRIDYSITATIRKECIEINECN